jgi:chromosome segregation ATPase
MLWVIGFLVLVVFLAIPILAIVLDSPALNRFVESRRGNQVSASDLEDLRKRLGVLEDEVGDLSTSLQTLRDETQFLQRLLESAEEKSTRLPPAR